MTYALPKVRRLLFFLDMQSSVSLVLEMEHFSCRAQLGLTRPIRTWESLISTYFRKNLSEDRMHHSRSSHNLRGSSISFTDCDGNDDKGHMCQKEKELNTRSWTRINWILDE